MNASDFQISSGVRYPTEKSHLDSSFDPRQINLPSRLVRVDDVVNRRPHFWRNGSEGSHDKVLRSRTIFSVASSAIEGCVTSKWTCFFFRAEFHLATTV